MRQLIKRPQLLDGTLTVPGDKSISHRALMLASVARGLSTVSGLSEGDDVLATLRCLKNLGVEIENVNGFDKVAIRGRQGALQESSRVLNAANSGTTVRLLAGLLASQPFLSVLAGDASLHARPMGRVINPLRLMGANVAARSNDTLLPLAIRGGHLKGIDYTLPVASAQVKSSLILAGLHADGETFLHQPALSRDHTERMISVMGAEIEEKELTLVVRPCELSAIDLKVPGDISAAAFWMVAATCHPNAKIRLPSVGINPTRTGILEVLRAMGAKIRLEREKLEGAEPVADLVVESSSLEGIEIGGDFIPKILDELPVLALAACFAKGTTVIKNAQELRVKESDRVRTTVKELSRLGASIEEHPDGMVIHGTGRLNGAQSQCYGDHRLAMVLGVAALLADGETVINDAEAVRVSYPKFWQDLELLSE